MRNLENFSNNYLYNIFIVDDNHEDHAFLSSAIKKIIPNALIKSFFDGSEVLEYLFESSRFPDLIFLDIKMSKLGGKETLTIIKHNAEIFRFPIVVLTSDSSVIEKETIIGLGAKDYFTKPWSYKELIEIIEKVRNEFLVKNN